ncbi:hypothetical protein BS47DRAFT_57315 [Hydnum rufescens UP504]|uniref:Protein SQS1 n=1 Tax=Hydnum rufescens UP504 TaxID=1448309 RepID=A0A9P6AS17_9AGAM|nr:hypothetical protein BS47DRAFT_57315 [Hydnum rufescens UP504]
MVGEDTDVGDAADSEGDNESSSDSSDIDLSFRTRLTKVRSSVARALSRLTDSDSMDDTSDDGDDDNFGTQPTWADRDDAVIAVMQDVVDSDAELLSGRSKKKRKQVFKAIQNGDLDAVEDIHNRNNDVAQGKGKKKKKEGAYVPPELKDQWRKDQEKKAKYKKDRAKERMLASMDLLPSRKSGKKKNKLGKRISEEPQPAEGETTPIVDLRSLVSQIRVFLADLGSSKTMVLPPMDKPSRARVHSIASCFKLKSQSKGWGSARYTTLIRTTKSGVSVDERKISWLLEGKGFGLGTPFSRPQGPVRHRDGDVVGSKAAKIGESNVGFRLLRQMGWSEGEHIGVTGGLADPLRIVIKNSKRGLGSSGRT